MTPVTLRVLEGADRGRNFDKLPTPISIGREEGNTIQLNDDRVSRFHLKIHWDQDQLVLTDLESTNGTKVNGEDTTLKIIREGDLITVGRSTLIVGSREQINRRLSKLNQPGLEKQLVSAVTGDSQFRAPWDQDPNYPLALLNVDRPQLPAKMSPGQAAQLAEVLDFLHIHLRKLISDCEASDRGEPVKLSAKNWQQLLDLQSRVAEYLRDIGR